MTQEIEQKLNSIVEELISLNIPFSKGGNLASDLMEILDLIRKTKEIRFSSVAKDMIFSVYKLMIEHKISQGTSHAECVWAMSNQIKDLSNITQKGAPCGTNNKIRQIEVEALLDLIMLTTMESRQK